MARYPLGKLFGSSQVAGTKQPIHTLSVDSSGNVLSGSAVSLADGADVTEGAVADAKVLGDNSGTLKAAIRGLGFLFNDIIDTTLHYMKVNIQNATLAVTQSGTWTTSGPTAAGASLTVNPLTTGALARTSPPTAVTNAQVVNLQTNIYGEQIVRHALRETKVGQQTQISSSTSETTILTADATYKLDVYGLVLTNTSATGTKVTIKDSTTGTTRFVFWVPANDVRGFMLPACDGYKQTAANNNWTATCGTSIAALEVTVMAVQNL